MLCLTELLFTLSAAKLFFISMNYFTFFSNAVIAKFMMSWKYSAVRAHMWLKKVWNVTNNAVIKCVIRALSICTSKNSVFPDFLIRLNRISGFFFTKTCLNTSGLIYDINLEDWWPMCVETCRKPTFQQAIYIFR